jgi:hypothetical protein
LPSNSSPRLSLADGKIYTFLRDPNGMATPGDSYGYAVVDPDTGAVEYRQPTGTGLRYDTLQLVGTITPDRVQYQGPVGGVLRIAAR